MRDKLNHKSKCPNVKKYWQLSWSHIQSKTDECPWWGNKHYLESCYNLKVQCKSVWFLIQQLFKYLFMSPVLNSWICCGSSNHLKVSMGNYGNLLIFLFLFVVVHPMPTDVILPFVFWYWWQNYFYTVCFHSY